MPIADFANEVPPYATLHDLSGMLMEEDLKSPIDMYFSRVKEALSYGTADQLTKSESLGRLLFLSIVSASEAYFRSIMSIAMEICPLARAGAAEKTINLGGLLWHGQLGFSRSAFDNLSFASSDELRKASEQFLGFKLEAGVFQSPLSEFDKICHFRHGIVHGDGLLPGRNAVKLDVPRFERPVRIVIRYPHLQDAAAVVTTLVTLYNRALFELMCRRWAVDWRKRADWKVEAEKSLFRLVWDAFVSREELARRTGRSRMRKLDCMNAVKAMYGV